MANPTYFTAGQNLTAANMNGLLNNRWIAKLNANQTMINTTDTAITWPTPDSNLGGMWQSGALVTATVAGIYNITCSPYWAANAVGFRAVHLVLNGTTSAQFIESDVRPATGSNAEAKQPKISGNYVLAANDAIRFFVWQDSGGNLDLAAGLGPGTFTRASVIYLGPAV